MTCTAASRERANEVGSKRALQLADNLVRQAISKNPTADADELEPIIKTSLDFLGVQRILGDRPRNGSFRSG